MQIEFTIIAKNKELFNLKLTEQLMKALNDLEIDNTKILAIQFKNADDFNIYNFIDTQFYRHDGTYLHEGKFYWKDELYKMIKPYYKTCSVSVAEKDLGARYPESEKQKRFGYINYAEFTAKQFNTKGLNK